MTKEYRQYKKALKVNSANDMVFKTKRRMLAALNVVSSVQKLQLMIISTAGKTETNEAGSA